MRRLLREAYRLNKPELIDLLISQNIRLNILFTLTQHAYSVHRELVFRCINSDMKAVLERIAKKIEK